ncbi:MAG: hypothetical protein A2798_00815 [Candidatus Levybacteria bacterium RIFCSPHIGHO2_01_FULL_37_17]|nr:MAG: hypothetical protein A2798_00815 [Candidatus Levybacteria bacterium RIFCSPHIGHO2_01_FULL_37_17]OGH37198.1 MAG: hypothetical protein A2959_01675 [Candidatus Levybacteria bacterium RIFCSPLOWO2_01_FULL_38_23]
MVLLSFVWPPDSPWAPWWRTSKEVARKICKLSKVGSSDIIYDLGSGDGTALIVAAKEFGATGVGIEIDPGRAFISKMLVAKNKVSRKVRIERKNFFDVNLSDASVIFLYLVPKTLEKLIPKFRKELKKGTKIVSYRYKMDLELIGNSEDLYLYTI